METFCIDASVFLHVLLSRHSKTSRENVEASEKVIDLLQEEKILAVAPAVVMAEIKWVIGRENKNFPSKQLKEKFGEIDALFFQFLRKNLEIVSIDVDLASEAAEYRLKYYSRQNDFSYNDALYLATALRKKAKYLITTDTHLLKVEEISALEPIGLLDLYS
ncbi:type II toxin-antitoxin system VapC family toxin [Candidatus Oleimmundimicrobium sp.]|uniref:type II toxin-antitoxin system VapC family toxin n=1 Tax=Candidatus Oleimmundimicrobium sp. TaxID=3060597 RepID=UPI00271758E3|nr:type II toxin-antitoxin system VapC family toxin [Candidatus Oleimmundimicrobium sp.]MDO8886338.1 type II toxin-antitoxin system VapC family toxin [Candidatus Oleimmundimicrobium sp.]